MDNIKKQTFRKKEKLCNKKLISLLFKNGILIQYDNLLNIRYLFINKKKSNSNTQFLIVIPKKNIKNAVDRNKIRRRIREICRQNKYIIPTQEKQTLIIGIMYQSSAIKPFKELKKSILEQMSKIV